MDEMNWDAGYGRISADDDVGDVSSSEAQEKACSEFAQEMGFTELEFVYRERGSGSGPDRPEFERLMQAARDGQMECVVVYDLSSLSRDPSEVIKVLRELNRLGVGFRIVEPDQPEGAEGG